MPQISVHIVIDGKFVPATLDVEHPEELPKEFAVKIASSRDESTSKAHNTFALERECKKLVRDLLFHVDVKPFEEDLKTIQQKLEHGAYANEDYFASEIRLVWKNNTSVESRMLSQLFECRLSAMTYEAKKRKVSEQVTAVESKQKKHKVAAVESEPWEPPEALKCELLKKCALRSDDHVLMSDLLRRLDDSTMVGCLFPHSPYHDQDVYDRLVTVLKQVFPSIKDHEFNATDYRRLVPAHYRQRTGKKRVRGRFVLGLTFV